MPPELLLHTDASLLRLVLGNLIDNALKYSPPRSDITILIASSVYGTRAGAQISIQNLPGVAGWPDATEVFKKYYRSPRAHHQTGSGLGLYLVHSTAHMLGGEMRYAPDAHYVRFTLWLPA
jgi:K+-sensing histidine kinase KdpD